jgi:branched-chain amino acid transport system ATP-binding protein
MSTVLAFDAVSKSFGRLEVLREVSLSVGAGQLLGIVGPNGAGKSTLFNVASGDVRADDGRTSFDGRDITSLDPAARSRAGIGRTYQIPRPFPKMTVFENALVSAQHAGRGRVTSPGTAALEAIDRTGLKARVNQIAGELTLLDRKRLEVCRALAAHPRLLLLDEVAGGLTEPEVLELVDIVRQLKREGLTIVWIEHVVHALLAVADTLACLASGAVLKTGDPAEVMSSPEVREVYLGVAPEEDLADAVSDQP